MQRNDATNSNALGRDAAYATNIGSDWRGLVLGYLAGPGTYHAWTGADWDRFAGNYKLPCWVPGQGGEPEAWSCIQQLYALGVPRGKVVVVDMETRVDITYLNKFAAILNWAGFLVWVYGSAESVFGNPELNGYAVADWTGSEFMYAHRGVRMTQYASDQQLHTGYDDFAVKMWELQNLWR